MPLTLTPDVTDASYRFGAAVKSPQRKVKVRRRASSGSGVDARDSKPSFVGGGIGTGSASGGDGVGSVGAGSGSGTGSAGGASVGSGGGGGTTGSAGAVTGAGTASPPKPPRVPGADDAEDLVPIGEYLCSRARHGDTDKLGLYLRDIDCVDLEGGNILMSACVAGQVSVVQWYFSNAPADRKQLFDRNDYSCTCVHFAAMTYNDAKTRTADCMKLVVEAGADINAVDNAGLTALHLAAQNGFEAVVEYLLSRPECDPSIKDLCGCTASAHAQLHFPSIAVKIDECVCHGVVLVALLRDVGYVSIILSAAVVCWCSST